METILNKIKPYIEFLKPSWKKLLIFVVLAAATYISLVYILAHAYGCMMTLGCSRGNEVLDFVALVSTLSLAFVPYMMFEIPQIIFGEHYGIKNEKVVLAMFLFFELVYLYILASGFAQLWNDRKIK